MTPCQVLLVDDDPDVRDSLKDALEASGQYAVATAENGRDALDLIGRGVSPDVILLDLKMPVMDGPTFHAELRRQPRYDDTAVIVVSATANRSDPVIARSEGFVRKPVRLDDLLELLDQHC